MHHQPYTGSADVTVKESPTITAPSAASVCFSSGSQTTQLTYSAVTGDPTTYSITWNASPANNFVPVTDAWTGSPITISIPAGTAAGTYTGTITVRSANDCASAGTTFTVTVNPLPMGTLTNSGPICIGGSANLIFTATTGTGPYDLVIDGTPYPNIPNGGVVTSVTPVSDMTYTLTSITDKGVTPNCPNTVSASTTVIVNALPTAGLTSNDPDNTICAGDPVTFTASGAGTGTYEFFVGSTSQGAASTNATFTTSSLLNGQIVTVKVTNENGCIATSAGIPMTVKDLPAAPFAGNNGAVCVGRTISLTASDISGATYSWTGPDAFISSEQNPTVSSSATLSMAGLYKVTATVNGCAGPEGTTNVIVNPPPVATIGSNSPICELFRLELTSGGGTSYSWTGPAGFTSGAQNPYIDFVDVSASGTYEVTVTDNNGCTSVATTDVTIIPYPDFLVSEAFTICEGSALHLTSSGGDIYSWTGPNGYTSSEQNPTINNATPAESGEYTVHIINNTCYESTLSVVVTVRPTPQPTISGSIELCQGDAAPLVTFANPQSLPVIITYNINGGTNSTINVNANSSGALLLHQLMLQDNSFTI